MSPFRIYFATLSAVIKLSIANISTCDITNATFYIITKALPCISCVLPQEIVSSYSNIIKLALINGYLY